MLGDILYQLTPRDFQITWLEPLALFEQLTGAVAAHNIVYTPPQGRVLLLQNFSVLNFPGAGTSVTLSSASITADPTGANTGSIIKELTAETSGSYDGIKRGATAAANTETVYQWNGELIVAPGMHLLFKSNYSAAAASNLLRAHWQGVLIPRGNITA